MATFRVPVARTYRARHVAFVEVEAATTEAARQAATDQLEEDSSLDPESYDNTHETEGYDDCGSWEVDTDRYRQIERVAVTRQDPWFYEVESRTLFDGNRLPVARDVGPQDAAAILTAMGVEVDFPTDEEPEA